MAPAEDAAPARLAAKTINVSAMSAPPMMIALIPSNVFLALVRRHRNAAKMPTATTPSDVSMVRAVHTPCGDGCPRVVLRSRI